MKLVDYIDVNKEEFGGKAQGLKSLVEKGINIPKGFVIDEEFIMKILKNDENALKILLNKIDEMHFDGSLAVRSSASNEDGSQKSSAGIYETELSVVPHPKDIVESIEKVYNSKYSDKVSEYFDESSRMNIIIQEMVDAKFSGVCFTDAIDIDGENIMYIEFVDGLGEQLVSGRGESKKIKYSYESKKIKNQKGTEFEEFKNLILDIEKLNKLSSNALDIEWSIDKNDRVFLLQERPITENVILNEISLNGAIASTGNCTGTVYKIDDELTDRQLKKRIMNIPNNSIIVAKTTDTNYVPAMKKCIGIITTEGSILSHAAIIAREFKIPCITGFKNAFSLFEDGEKVSLDTNKKKILYKEKVIEIGKGNEINLLELYIFDNITEDIVNDKTVLVEFIGNEFGIHIDDEIEQKDVNLLDIHYRKKYKRAPVILNDQKYLWYFELKRFMKIPGFEELLDEIEFICNTFDIKMLESLVEKNIEKLTEVFHGSISYRENFVAGEYAQAVHFALNLYMCNGLAMKNLMEKTEELGYNNLTEMLEDNNNLKYKDFFNKISNIRENIWSVFIENNFSDDDYFDDREERASEYLKMGDQDNDPIDFFYENFDSLTEKSDLLKNKKKTKSI